MGVSHIKKIFLTLPLQERLRLLYELWDEVSSDAEGFELSPNEQRELERRFEEHLARPESSEPWDSVRDQFRSRP